MQYLLVASIKPRAHYSCLHWSDQASYGLIASFPLHVYRCSSAGKLGEGQAMSQVQKLAK